MRFGVVYGGSDISVFSSKTNGGGSVNSNYRGICSIKQKIRSETRSPRISQYHCAFKINFDPKKALKMCIFFT